MRWTSAKRTRRHSLFGEVEMMFKITWIMNRQNEPEVSQDVLICKSDDEFEAILNIFAQKKIRSLENTINILKEKVEETKGRA